MKPFHIYGWKKPTPDKRDFAFGRFVTLKNFAIIELPPSASNQSLCSPVEDQSTLGSCTANAWVGLLEFKQIKNSGSYVDMSRLFVYYNERVVNGTVGEDSGAQLRDGAKVLNQYGVCAEAEWPYDITTFTNKPTDQCYTDALPNCIHSYYSLTTLTDFKMCLANQQCFVFGTDVYSSFESDDVASTGIVPMPDNEELLGGHALMCVGYNDEEQMFLVRNSWGKGWGINGYCKIPYAYIQKYASDFWTLKT